MKVTVWVITVLALLLGGVKLLDHFAQGPLVDFVPLGLASVAWLAALGLALVGWGNRFR